MISKFLFSTLLALLPLSGFAEGFTLRGFGGYNSISYDNNVTPGAANSLNDGTHGCSCKTGTVIFRDLKIKDGTVVGLALGYRFADFVRGEIEGSYRRNELHQELQTGIFTIHDKGDLESFSCMTNAVFSWPQAFFNLQPYIGVGLGCTAEFANWHTCIIDETVLYDLVETTRLGISYQALAGIHLPPYNNLYCGIEFRILDSVIDHMCCCNRSIIFSCRKEF